MIKYIFIVGLLFPLSINAQIIKGKVTNHKNEPVLNANIYWIGSSKGVNTDKNGEFEISSKDIFIKKLIVTHVGYAVDTLDISNQTSVRFSLKPKQDLAEVTITGHKDGVIISNLLSIKTEQITQTELRKAACCDLAGCFETQTTVQPQTTNVLTNSKELRILGLSGVYNQILVDGFPIIQGLSYTYGISGLPGTLVDNIYVSKGANSVLQGYESISGQINIETKEPDKSEKLLLNAYINSFAEKHLNANFTSKHGKWKSLAAFHMVQPASKTDKDKDNFLDLPLLTRYMFYNKWKYGNERNWGWNSKIAIRFINEQRIGGQTNYSGESDKGSQKIYSNTVNLSQPEIRIRTGYRLNDKHNFVLMASVYRQDQQSYFGTVKYDATQNSMYANIQHELNYKKHDLKSGISYRHLNLTETIGFMDTALKRTYSGKHNRTENIPGVYTENTMRLLNRLTWIAGIRTDYYKASGVMVTPKTMIKYDLNSNTIVRANIGTGWRNVNLFSENINLLASSRDVVFAETLKPEQAINTGINLTQKFKTLKNGLSGYFSADFYHTNFQNQIFPDYDTDPTKAIIKNYTGTSISNGLQAELFMKLKKGFELKVGYNFLDVYRVMDGIKTLLPFNPKHKIVGSFSFKPSSGKYHFDMNAHWFGEQRLPDTKSNPEEYQRPAYSKPYTTVNAQFTYIVKQFEIYGGCENIFNFRQNQPIVSWQNPFSPYFDTSSVWGPTRGRELYLGLRYIIKQKK
jgi:outer membrane receptor for ferrienterochelin and colicins